MYQRSMRKIGLLTAIATMLIVTTAAQAKGPSKASVTGPGLEGAVVFGGRGEDGGYSPLGRLTREAGFFPAVFGEQPDPMMPRRPTGRLGPRYTITYVVPGSRRRERIRQYVYPYAPGGPVTYMLAGQRFWETSRTFGGWYRAPVALKRTLVRAGLPATAPAAAIRRVPGDEGGGQTWPYVVGGVGAAILLAGGAFALARRPRPAAAR